METNNLGKNYVRAGDKIFDLDQYFRTTTIGSIQRAVGNNMYGINHRQTKSAVPSNHDMYGMNFFVRPQLNLRDDNLALVPSFYPLMASESKSVQRYVRCMLDPRLQYDYTRLRGSTSKAIVTMPAMSCPLVDKHQAFIPTLTNNIKSISGFPDIVTPTWDSKPGLRKEVYSQVDGTNDFYEAIDINATFRNTIGDPILYMIYIWTKYQSMLFSGKCRRYLDFIAENEIDYNTRIYRLVLGRDRRTITKLLCTGASYPTTLPIGPMFDFNDENVVNTASDEFSIQFKSMGVIVFDDIIVHDFNATVEIFNPAMRDEHRSTYMMAIPKPLLIYFNHRGYPYIDSVYRTLDWWLPISAVKKVVSQMSSKHQEYITEYQNDNARNQVASQLT